MQACITFLSFDAFVQETEDSFLPYPTDALYEYSARHWAEHARLQPVDEEILYRFLLNDKKVSCCLALLRGLMDEEGPGRDTGLYLAAYPGLTSLAQLLLEHFGVDTENGWYETPLAMAVMGARGEMVKFLIRCCADVNSRNNTGQTPLFHAIDKSHYSMVETLLDAGADPDAADQDGLTPFLLAVQFWKSWSPEENCKMLMQKSREMHIYDQGQHVKSLDIALEYDNSVMMEVLLDAGVNPSCYGDPKDPNTRPMSRSSLSLAAAKGNRGAVSLILKRISDKTATQQVGQPALIQAANMVALKWSSCSLPGALKLIP